MHAYMEGVAKATDVERRLTALRSENAKGDTSKADLITQLEGELETAQDNLVTLRNAVVTAETGEQPQ